MAVYPDGVWYSGVKPADVPEIVREHFEQGRPVARLANADAVALNKGDPGEPRQGAGGARRAAKK